MIGRTSIVVVAIAVAGTAFACASPPPPDEIAEAEEAIALARARDAATYAPLPLRKAEEKLAEARRDARDDDDEDRRRARRLAEQAKVDAQLALAESERAQTRRNVDELARTIEALEEELDDDLD